MDKSMKLYTKAIECYNKGNIEKALEFCEKSISENLKNTSSINLKGLLYYLKGELDNAQGLWKMNSQVNKDSVSKKYLEDSKNDEKKMAIYNAALMEIKELKIREALKMLSECRESDFNSINVNNYIAFCYIKLGEYAAALKHINIVLGIDKKDQFALKNKKELTSFGVIKKEINYKYLGIAFVIILLIGSFSIVYKNSMAKYADKNLLKNKQILKIVDEAKVEKQNESRQPDEQKKDQPADKKNIEFFPSDDINRLIASKDYEKLYEIYNTWKDKELNINNKTLLMKVKDIISGEGIEYFYNKGSQALSSKEYNKSINYLSIAYNYGEKSYLYSHAIYLIAVSYKNSGDIENSIKYYKEYTSKYPNGDYNDAVLYELTLLYKNIDNDTAVNYAKSLNKQYPKSMYNNSIIKSIITK
ncbi:tetratricopeptide repeat protein [Clostridiales bacterium oral taxon 876 str. F0540]|nr:tetratricopeptide repeat protein [Clostridiales bacterium oral taxon 876 str. F0540]